MGAVDDGANATVYSLLVGHECSWDPDGDTNRPPTKQLVASLRIKIQVLEAEIRDLQEAPVRSVDTQPSHSPDGFLSVSGADLPTPNEFRPMNDATTHHDLGRWEQDYLQATPGAGSNLASGASIDSTYQYIFNINTSIPLEQQAENVQQSLSCDWCRHLPDLDGATLTRLEHDKILDRLFLSDMLLSLSQNPLHLPPSSIAHYSASLHNSLIAFACAYSDEPLVKQRATRDRFAQRANQLLKKEFHHPSLTLVQALAILSEYYCSVGELSKGHMFMGMSVRALRTIELKGEQAFQSSSSELSSHESEMALECNSDFGLPSRRANAPPPWTGNGHINFSSPQFALTSDAHSNNQLARTFGRTCELMQIAEDLVVSTIQNSSTYNRSKLSIIQRKLDNWLNNLPVEMRIPDNPISPWSHVIVLNICYWWLILLAHRPFYSASSDSTPILGDTTNSQYRRAACKILELVVLYARWHPPHFFPRNMVQTIFAAGQAFLHEFARTPVNANTARSSALSNIQGCIGALHIVSGSWDHARKLATQLETWVQVQE